MERAWCHEGYPEISLASKPVTPEGGWGAMGGIRLSHSCGKRNAISLLLPSLGSISSRDLADISPTPNQQCCVGACKQKPWEDSTTYMDQPHGKVMGHWEQHGDGGQVELVKPCRGLEGSPTMGPLSSTSPCPEMGRGTGNYTPLSPTPLQPRVFVSKE